MADTLDAAGNSEAATETRQFLNEAQAFAALAETRLSRLRKTWKAVEMGESPHVPDPEGKRARSDSSS